MSGLVQIEINKKNRWVYFTRYRWIAHLIYWLWVFVVGTLMTVKVPITPSVIFNHFVLENLLIAIFYYLYCLVLIPYYFKRNRNMLFWILVVGSYLFFTALDIWFTRTFVTFYSENPLNGNLSFWDMYSYSLGGYLLNFMVFSMMLFFMEKNEEGHTILELENEKKEIEQVKLDLLKTNISPDFLMRSLKQLKQSAISQDEHTPEAILTFSDLLRYRLYWGRQQHTPLQEELQALNNFIHFITLNHFKHHLDVVLNVQGDVTDQKIAPLSLINILELFCKVQSNKPVTLEINILIEQRQLVLGMEYHDTPPETLVADLDNYGNNYKQLFGSSVQFHFENCEDARCTINLLLPLR
jgi:two-component system, LytTR family, sensor kinase